MLGERLPGLRRHIHFEDDIPVQGDPAVRTVSSLEVPQGGGPKPMLRIQTALPERYIGASADALDEMIGAAKASLGERVFILGHHYQRDEVMRWADARGDSYRLSVLAQERPEAEHIVFCGVHFLSLIHISEPTRPY